MKKNLFLLGLFITICSISSAQKLVVASYNVRNSNAADQANGNGWSQRCPVMCDLIRFNDFDIFGAQEVRDGQLVDLLNGLPDYAYIGVGRDDGKKAGEYSPILYKTERIELEKSGHFWLSTITDRPNKGWDAVLPRICTWGRFVDKQTGKDFWLFNLHMDHIGVEARSRSAELVLAKIGEMCGNEPTILMGDFNVDQNNESYKIIDSSKILDDSYRVAKIRYATNGTFNSFDANSMTDKRIDHIFVTPSYVVERYGILTDSYRMPIKGSEGSAGSEKQKYDARMPSDHFPVKIVVTLVD